MGTGGQLTRQLVFFVSKILRDEKKLQQRREANLARRLFRNFAVAIETTTGFNIAGPAGGGGHACSPSMSGMAAPKQIGN